jgi:hypothetical protein
MVGEGVKVLVLVGDPAKCWSGTKYRVGMGRSEVRVFVGVEVVKGPDAEVGELSFREHPDATIKKVAGTRTANRAHRRKDFMLPPEKRYRGM